MKWHRKKFKLKEKHRKENLLLDNDDEDVVYNQGMLVIDDR